MTDLIRLSPVVLPAKPKIRQVKDEWEVILEYENQEQSDFHLIDLSHVPKWDIQDSDLDALRPFGLEVPGLPGECNLAGGVLITRLNMTQASVWELIPGQLPRTELSCCSDITDAQALLALMGPYVIATMQKISELDLADARQHTPFMLQGPVTHVPNQVAVLERSSAFQCVAFAFSRGYGRDMAEIVLESGQQWGIRPGGESIFNKYLHNRHR